MIWTSSLAGMKSFATDLVLCVPSSLLLALSQPILGPRRDETCFGLRCKPAPLWTQATDFDKAFITSPNLCKRLLLLAQQMESPSVCPQSLCATVLRRGNLSEQASSSCRTWHHSRRLNFQHLWPNHVLSYVHPAPRNSPMSHISTCLAMALSLVRKAFSTRDVAA
jgi:hypothetical protein